jgi:arginine decarboxylase-like protein
MVRIALINQANDILQWYENHIGKQIDRLEAQRKTVYEGTTTYVRLKKLPGKNMKIISDTTLKRLNVI